MLSDLRYAFRLLAKSPGFTAIVVLTLALGIGANTAIFSVVNTAFMRALPYPEPEQLVHVAERNPAGDTFTVSYPNFVDWHEQQDVFSSLAFFHGAEGRLKTARGTEIVEVQHVSADFFKVLGIRPARGREMRPEDDVEGAPLAAWVTHDAWRRHFDEDPELVGRAFVFDGQSFTVAGILPAEFRFHRSSEVFTTIAPFARQFFMNMRENHNNAFAIARLDDGVSLEAAQARMDAIARRLEQDYPAANKGIGVVVEPLRDRLIESSRTLILVSLGAVGLVLLIACVNVANMLLARSFSREREMAIRTSLGASRWQQFRQLFVESLVLAGAGGATGALAGYWGFELVGRMVPYQVQRVVEGGGFDLPMLLFIVAVTLVTGVAFGLAPAWQLSHIRPLDALKQTTRDVRTVFGRVRLSDILVVGQVSLALTLLVVAGLMIRSLNRLMAVETGFEAGRVLTLEVAAPPSEQFQRDPGSFTRHFEQVLAAVEGLPGVEAAAIAQGMPFTYKTNRIVFYREDLPVPAAGEFPVASLHSVTLDYFRAMGIPLLRGNAFDGTEPVLALPEGVELSPQTLGIIFKDVTFAGVISQKMAERLWPGEDPIGKRFRLGYPDLGLPWVDVIGIVGSTVQAGLDRGEETEFYLSLRQWPVPVNMHLVIRSQLDPKSMAGAVQSAVAAVAVDAPVRDVQVLSDRIESSTALRRFHRNVLACFAATSLLLAVIGVYGVLAFNVGRRTREVGIRMALGASSRDVIRGVVARGLALVLPGVALGLGLAWAVGRLVESQLFGVTAGDPLTYAAGAIVLLATAVAAALVPARRAARVNPLTALRAE